MSSNNSKRFAMLALLVILIIVVFVYYWITTSSDKPQPDDGYVDQFPSSGDSSVNPRDDDMPGLITRDVVDQTSVSTGTEPTPVYDYSFNADLDSPDQWQDDVEEYSANSFFADNGSDEVSSIVQQNNGGPGVYDQAAQDISFQESVTAYNEANDGIGESLTEFKRNFQEDYDRTLYEELVAKFAARDAAVAELVPSASVSIDMTQFISHLAAPTGLAHAKNCGYIPNRNDLEKDLESLALQIEDQSYTCVGKAIVNGCESVLTENESGAEYIADIEGIGCSYGITFNDVSSDIDYAYFCPFTINQAIVEYAEDLGIDKNATRALEVMVDSLKAKSPDGFISDIDLYTSTNGGSATGVFNYSTRQFNDEVYALIARMVVPDTSRCQRFDR